MIEYIDEEHLYLVDGVLVPSVTQLLHKLFPNKYKNVPQYILDKKAIYGSKVHKAIEELESNKLDKKEIKEFYIQLSINEYFRLKKKYEINVLEQEQIIHYKKYFAGRFDMVAIINGELCLCDIKTTAELDKEYLSWQLSMYELGDGRHFDKFYCIWLPKGGLGKLVEIERIEKEKILKEIGVII